jgi:hypothetical protein
MLSFAVLKNVLLRSLTLWDMLLLLHVRAWLCMTIRQGLDKRPLDIRVCERDCPNRHSLKDGGKATDIVSAVSWGWVPVLSQYDIDRVLNYWAAVFGYIIYRIYHWMALGDELWRILSGAIEEYSGVPRRSAGIMSAFCLEQLREAHETYEYESGQLVPRSRIEAPRVWNRRANFVDEGFIVPAACVIIII